MIRVGIIGTGLIAHEHAQAIAASGGQLRLTAAADVSAERLTAFAKAFGVSGCHAQAEALITDPNVDLIVVATPPSSHEALVVAALDAGKYVLCEKPLAHSLASARRIVEAETRHPGRLSVSYQLRYLPSFRRLACVARQGWLGQVREAMVERHGYIPHAEHGATGWWGVWGVAGGGVLITQMIHELDLLVQAMGMPTLVKAIADTRFTNIESEDFLEATLTFADGRTAHCSGSVNSGTVGGNFLLRGESGEATLTGRLDLIDPARELQAARAADAAAPLPVEPIGGVSGKIAARLGLQPKAGPSAHTLLYLDIADAVARGAPLPISATEALPSLELCMAAYESAITGKPVALPLGSDAHVYDGVKAKDFADRKCDRDRMGVFIPPPSPTPAPTLAGAAVGAAVGVAKRVFSVIGLEPPVIKAMIRKPAPVHGGPKTRIRSWPRRRTFSQAEKRAVVALMDREIRTGEAIRYGGIEEQAYCEAFAKYLGGGYADAVNSGTNAVYVALKALDLEPGSEVIVPPVTDAGSTMPVAVMNCIPVVADSAPGSILVSVDQIEAVLSPRTSAIVIAHIAGHAVDLDPILALAAKRNLPVVEDCAQAHGTLYKGRMVGSFGDLATFSTMFLKNHTTGGQGGVVFTRNPRLFARAKQVADRGKAFGMLDPKGSTVASLNFNQDEISMAIGRVQLPKLTTQVAARRAFAALVQEGLQGIEEVQLIGDPPESYSSYHFLMLRLDVDSLGCTVEEFAAGLTADGIGGVGSYRVYPTDNPWHREAVVFGTSRMPWSLRPTAPDPQTFDLPNARALTRTLLRVDLYEGMGASEAADLVTALRKAVRWYKGSRG